MKNTSSLTDLRLEPLLRQMPEAYHRWEETGRHPRFRRIEKRVARLLAQAEKKAPPTV